MWITLFDFFLSIWILGLAKYERWYLECSFSLKIWIFLVGRYFFKIIIHDPTRYLYYFFSHFAQMNSSVNIEIFCSSIFKKIYLFLKCRQCFQKKKLKISHFMSCFFCLVVNYKSINVFPLCTITNLIVKWKILDAPLAYEYNEEKNYAACNN